MKTSARAVVEVSSITLASGGVLAVQGLHMFSPRLELSWGHAALWQAAEV